MENSDLYNKIKDKYGIDAMRDIWIEELNELAVALAHHKRGKCMTRELEKEVADVLICIYQMFDTGEANEIRVTETIDDILSQLPKKLKLE